MEEVNRRKGEGYAFMDARNGIVHAVGDVYATRDEHGKAGAYAIREYLCCQEMRAAKGCTGRVCSRETRGTGMAAPQRVRGDSAGTGFADANGDAGSGPA